MQARLLDKELLGLSMPDEDYCVEKYIIQESRILGNADLYASTHIMRNEPGSRRELYCSGGLEFESYAECEGRKSRGKGCEDPLERLLVHGHVQVSIRRRNTAPA